ncbi:MAG: anaerobic ribonucleoside-triphosphate reductase activating protein, partial [Betaproteobacteria bacterium]|nr:anaerobic ribonucleoside-triphosphate reductase activating protein [Betaproteobacteria bacterium]
LSRETVVALAETLAALGVRRYALQGFRPEGCASPALASVPQAGFLDPALHRELAGKFEILALRPA